MLDAKLIHDHLEKMRLGWPGCTPQPDYAKAAKAFYWALLGPYFKPEKL